MALPQIPVRPFVQVSFPEQISETHGEIYFILHTHIH